MNIAIAGLGYVGLSLACLLSQNNRVRALDVAADRVEAINSRASYFTDELINEFLETKELDLTASLEPEFVFEGADFIVLAVPTDYDEDKEFFDTSILESVMETAAACNPKACVVIKSTIPVGFTKTLAAQYPQTQLLFSPEFLREGRALYDNLYPARIVAGTADDSTELQEKASQFADLLAQSAGHYAKELGEKHTPVPTLIVGSSEAEAIKLFSNTYLALRVSFFNELDTYAESHALDAKQIIEGVGLDTRIGNHYNNPSFGYGGYCLPKDTKQLLANYRDIPQNLIEAIVAANQTRMDFVANSIAARKPACVGVYRLAMKEGSDNFRHSSIVEIMKRLTTKGISVLVYEPSVVGESVLGYEMASNLEELKARSDLIICNRMSSELADVQDKVYTRDLWQRD